MTPVKKHQCQICDDYGIVRECAGVRYCMCPTGREKKREWLELSDAERALFEASSPTLPDAEDLAPPKTVRRSA